MWLPPFKPSPSLLLLSFCHTSALKLVSTHSTLGALSCSYLLCTVASDGWLQVFKLLLSLPLHLATSLIHTYVFFLSSIDFCSSSLLSISSLLQALFLSSCSHYRSVPSANIKVHRNSSLTSSVSDHHFKQEGAQFRSPVLSQLKLEPICQPHILLLEEA